VYIIILKRGNLKMAKFNEVLKELRTSKNVTQAELAKAIGVSASTIGMYESGEREPNFETEEKIADYFNVSLDALRGKEDIQKTPSQIIMEGMLSGKYQKLTKPNQARWMSYYQALLDSQEDDKDGNS
jgi:transcriptional regulator with XRE-family HTH domain